MFNIYGEKFQSSIFNLSGCQGTGGFRASSSHIRQSTGGFRAAGSTYRVVKGKGNRVRAKYSTAQHVRVRLCGCQGTEKGYKAGYSTLMSGNLSDGDSKNKVGQL
jgi:hypothetical protein